MSLNLRPLNDYIFVEPLKNEEKTTGGIFLPSSVQEKNAYAKVLAISAELEEKKINLHRGDKVLFLENKGIEVKSETVVGLLLKYEDILAVIEK